MDRMMLSEQPQSEGGGPGAVFPEGNGEWVRGSEQRSSLVKCEL